MLMRSYMKQYAIRGKEIENIISWNEGHSSLKVSNTTPQQIGYGRLGPSFS